MNDDRLLLLGQTAEDLPAISALLQDATLRLPDIAFDRRARRLVFLVNRYRWEVSAPSRVRSALRIETVTAVQRQNWPHAPDVMLDLLNLSVDGDWLVLTFAAGAALRAQCEVLEVVLEDIAAPWPTQHVPHHPG